MDRCTPDQVGGGRALIDADGWVVRGWIPRLEASNRGWGRVVGPATSCWPWTKPDYVLRPGAPLYAEPGGEQIGRVVGWNGLAVSWTDDFVEVEELTPWGMATLWGDPADIVLWDDLRGHR